MRDSRRWTGGRGLPKPPVFMQGLIIVFLLLLNTAVMGQRPFGNLKVIETAFDSVNRVAVIPDSIFSLQPDLLYMPFPFDTIAPSDKCGFEIRWPSMLIDGSFVLTITKRQIYLVSTHNNPNPNHLYWFVNITPRQYKIVAEKINKEKFLFTEEPAREGLYVVADYNCFRRLNYEKFRRERTVSGKWTKKKSETADRDWRDKRYQNLDALISFLDNGLTVDDLIPFVTREDFDKIESVRIVYSEADYDGQIKLVRPDEVEPK